ncbi:ribosome biogenesis GTPase YlqF [Oceanirhabdus sp. W0125-5]|uniref:ribosome biogenesis GTPase YlqF n=1 Tax=Oceanirhabdus sp. W0125-5 TaxID=2999116 RepID=UPI0022F2F740|nr:ribosome biogenesis GTPase YlqF [Oceanirhabdus sp. W0125-5]WBW94814.1 ribosome biogenesis GTPase YlqF [Oceanirhabdus sp. W0125-5]
MHGIESVNSIKNINWYPGHMAKTKRKIQEELKLVDIVIEIRDARIVEASKNPEIDKICKGKPRVILLNKYDLAEDKVTNKWVEKLKEDNVEVVLTNCVKGYGINEIKKAIDKLMKDKRERMESKGVLNFVTRAMVVGIPNVGKSSFINRMAKGKRAKTGDMPGVTRSNQWIKTDLGIELLDTPGVLWPKFKDQVVAQNLAFTGAIKDEILNIEDLAYKLLERLVVDYPENLQERYKLDYVSDDPLETMEEIARKRGCLLKKGEINYDRVSVIILDEFRGGKIGKISIEKP